MIKHTHEAKTNPVNKCRYKLMAQTKRMYKTDGLNSLKYEVVKFEMLQLYTHIVVDLLEKEEHQAIKQALRC
ncbi:hypothetical protein OESDEN_02634 [Oesophagostomum dentatum]|uniref:Uncharacterized protein n=1 Tax=Oesophagostomum dentatum TaxID=61180 RepID=A0A0B1TMP6_OESDE|nr:hypothetical protein OESDEN_02634 [Oesophagostomum dentatum]